MTNCDINPVYAELEPFLEKYSGEGGLIAILQHAQDIYGYLSKDIMRYIADRTGIKSAKVYGVATFYAQFRFQPVGRHQILLCQGTACHVNGSNPIRAAVLEALGVEEGQVTEDGMFTCFSVACLGCCSLSPVMMIDGRAYGSLAAAKARKIIEDIRKSEVQA